MLNQTNITTGRIVGAFKPFTNGHYNLIKKACDECDELKIFWSSRDRKRKNELPIFFSDTKYLFDKFIKDNLPKNCNINIIFCNNPIQEFYNELLNLEKNINNLSFEGQYEKIKYYCDGKDKIFLQEDRNKNKLSNILNFISFETLERKGDNDISGTLAREYLLKNDINNFSRIMPNFMKNNIGEIFSVLKK